MSRRACRWPGCSEQVDPALWGCRRHWFSLPRVMRVRILNAYRSGQEIDLRLSREWIEADAEARAWAEESNKRAPIKQGRFYWTGGAS